MKNPVVFAEKDPFSAKGEAAGERADNSATEILIPISLDPPLKGYLGYAYPLSILFGEGDEGLPWVYSNFIQTVSLKDCSSFEYYMNSWWFSDERLLLQYYIVFPKFVLTDNFSDIKRLIMYMMKRGYCTMGVLNEYYVPHRFSYHRLNFDHDYLIYGYSGDRDVYRLIGYTDRRHYEPTEITGAQYLEALQHTEFEEFHVHFFKKNPEKTFAFDCAKVKRFLGDYLASKDSTGFYDDRYYLGIDAWRNLKNYLDLVNKDGGRIELRFLYVLKEHKECMLARIKYMEEHRYLRPDASLETRCQELISLAGFIESLGIRWNLLHDPAIIDMMEKNIDVLLAKEIPFLEDFLDRIGQEGTAAV